jgi:hypothetical protein
MSYFVDTSSDVGESFSTATTTASTLLTPQALLGVMIRMVEQALTLLGSTIAGPSTLRWIKYRVFHSTHLNLNSLDNYMMFSFRCNCDRCNSNDNRYTVADCRAGK